MTPFLALLGLITGAGFLYWYCRPPQGDQQPLSCSALKHLNYQEGKHPQEWE